MGEPPGYCTRCGQPFPGPVYDVSVGWAEEAPALPVLTLCASCYASMNHWIEKRRKHIRRADGEAQGAPAPAAPEPGRPPGPTEHPLASATDPRRGRSRGRRSYGLDAGPAETRGAPGPWLG